VFLVVVQAARVTGESWSPYYRINTLYDTVGKLHINVDGIPHQTLHPLDQPDLEQFYTQVYEWFPGRTYPEVLIVGAGSGSDAAIALSRGAQHVDAVEIDPRLQQIGAQNHPNRPYDDPRVTPHINDGRAFLRTTDKKYDLVVFALPDSLTLVSQQSNIRLESFLFTEEALRSAQKHLTDDGVFAMYNYYREDWLIDRLGGTVADAFGHEPCIDLFGRATAIMSAAKDPANQKCGPENYELPDSRVEPAHDDAPFLYYAGGMVPSIYLWALGGILLMSLIVVRILGGPFRQMRPYADLFFMGAAFLLLETKNIATFALLFGTTWIVNAMVFAGVLVIVLAAVETTRRLRTPPLPVVFGLIAASLALAYVVKPEWLLQLSFAPRLIAAVLLAFIPIYLANIAFAKRFAASADSQSAFAINLLGAMVGGCLEYSALITGYSNLLILVAVIYLAAFLLKPKATLAV
jgi:Spermine/spermidine synthase domain